MVAPRVCSRMRCKTKFLQRVDFAGVIANGRVFRGKGNKWVTFLTLGTNYGEYIDVTIQRPFAYRDGDVVAGSGSIKHTNNSDYIQCTDQKLFTLGEWFERTSKNRNR